MKLLFDQNISHRILKLLPMHFEGSTSVKSVGLVNASDREIWSFAKKNNYIIVSQDSDFNDLNSLYGFPPKIIWIRAGNLKTSAILEILLNHVDALHQFGVDQTYGCFQIFMLT